MTTNRDTETDRQRLRAIHEVMTAGDVARAGEMAAEALADGIEHPLALSLAAGRLEEAGQPAEALPLLLRARQLAPQAFGIVNALGLCLQRLDRHEDAERAFSAALAIAPDFAPALANRGMARIAQSRLVEARADLEAALALDPANLVALNGLAGLAQRRRDLPEARRLAEAVLARAPGFPPALLTLAEVELGEGQPNGAAARLAEAMRSPAIAQQDRATAEGLLGDALDALADHDAAYSAWERSGAAYKALHAPAFSAQVAPQVLMRDLTAVLAKHSRPIIASNEAGPPAHHVFLVGFPRSGTTLLEQILEQHPDIVTLAEKECLADSVADTLGSGAAFERFLDMGDAELQPMRRAYWQQVAKSGINPKDKVFVDKHPFHSFKLPLIARLFPQATILFAQRDPRDTVLSCFRRRFQINGPTFQFLDMASTVDLYDATMDFIRATGSRIPMQFERIRLEELIEDFEGMAAALCDRLGVDWTDVLRDFAAGAESRGVFTPSSSQIARGLNADGVGKWRDYAAQLAPHMDRLQPWIDRFGYAT